MTAGQVSCPSNAGTQIVAAANANTTYIGAGQPRTLVLYNPSAQGIYLGSADTVTSATGFLLAAGATVTVVLYARDAVYGRGASATPTIHFLETGT